MGAVNFLSKYFWPLSQITTKTQVGIQKLNYSSQLVTRALRKKKRYSGRRSTQQTEHKSELKRLNYARTKKNIAEKGLKNSKKNKPKEHRQNCRQQMTYTLQSTSKQNLSISLKQKHTLVQSKLETQSKYVLLLLMVNQNLMRSTRRG